jgi:2-methylcitrate dehydratase
VGALSHFKAVHQPWGVQGGVMAARLAKLGLTAPAQPFEERGGVWDSITGPYKGLKLPISSDGKLNAGYMSFKRFPADNNTQGILHQAAPAIRQWTKVEEIESIQVEYPFSHWMENADPPKWDPRNRETADHSMPFVLAIALTDGEVYLDAFTPKRYVEDQAIRELMNKITVMANPEFEELYYRSRVTVRKKSGEQMVKDVEKYVPVTHDDVIAKFKRVCAFKGVSDEQHDKLLATWSKLQDAHDIAGPISLMAKFGRPVAL